MMKTELISINKIQALKIIEIVNNYYRVECREDTRKREIVFPRQVAMYFIHKYGNLSLTKIGDLFKRDHASVLHSLKAISDVITSPESVRKEQKLNLKELKSDCYKTQEIRLKDFELFGLRIDISNIIQEMNEQELNKVKEVLLGIEIAV
ncbi:helix-turn-helix domain-containing protein [Polaribacter sp. IC073]|uniref:helix-turn-helix domain-containing protein n=1 Tax=Polaribacter sp. IC073 TaxID=2508540 RepID=UPI0011BFC75B|nr:helix-turn-helix domain-containing protein [Polaribacter sp. IC073]TXD45886.1 hypothetical protein ES045_15795 [Polaribacter sp. IC073]